MLLDVLRRAVQGLLGAFLLAAGVGHLGPLRTEFRAQVPDWLPVGTDLVVVASGLVELALGGVLLATALPLVRAPWWRRLRLTAGLTTAAFLVVVLVGNVAQYAQGTDAFGLDTDRARLVRLFFQPLLVAWALWPTGAAAWLGRRVSAARGRPSTYAAPTSRTDGPR